MTARVTIKRALEKAGFVFPKRLDYIRKEDAIRLQRHIDKAVQAAAGDVAKIREAMEAAPRLQDKIDRAVADAADGVEQVKDGMK